MTYESLASDTPSAVYTYGNERISVKDTEGKDTASSYYLYDGRGSVAQLADNTGVTRTLTYDPYGEITGGAKEYESLYGYNAEEYNTVTGLTYLRYRYLDNETGRFTQEDNYLGSIIEAVSLNRYTYANNNPVMYADPSGHWPKMSSIGKSLARNASKIGAVAGMVVGAAIATAVIIATAPVSVPVLATAAIAVGAVTVSAAIGGSIGNEIEKRQNQKDYADITNEQEDVTRQLEEYCSGEENIHNAETQQQISRLEQRRTQIEKKKKNICEKTAKIKKQEDIYTNLGYAGIGLIALGLAPVSGPAMAGELGLGTAKIAGTVAVSDAATVGAATAGALGTTYHSSNIIGTATGTNPVESYIYNGDTESFREDTALLDNINMTSSAYGMIGAGSKPGEEAVENLGERYDWGSETSYGKSTLNSLKNTENFTDSAIEHIFEGQVNARGKAVGYHYEGIEGTSGNVIPGMESSVNNIGIYKAKVEVNGIPKTANGGFSSFYPKSMSPQEVIGSINEAYRNRVYIRGNTYSGLTSSGMEIEMFLDKNGKIISAYPVY